MRNRSPASLFEDLLDATAEAGKERRRHPQRDARCPQNHSSRATRYLKRPMIWASANLLRFRPACLNTFPVATMVQARAARRCLGTAQGGQDRPLLLADGCLGLGVGARHDGCDPHPGVQDERRDSQHARGMEGDAGREGLGGHSPVIGPSTSPPAVFRGSCPGHRPSPLAGQIVNSAGRGLESCTDEECQSVRSHARVLVPPLCEVSIRSRGVLAGAEREQACGSRLHRQFPVDWTARSRTGDGHPTYSKARPGATIRRRAMVSPARC